MMAENYQGDDSPPDVDPAPYPETDDEDPEVYVEYTRAELEERRQSQIPFRTEWTQNLLFLAGLQWYRYSNISGNFILPRVAPWKERPVWNMLKPFAKSVMAKLTKNKPVTTCVPRSSDPSDIYAAGLGDDVLHAKWIELKLAKKLRAAIAWLIATGNGWIMTYWNENSGKLRPIEMLAETDVFDPETGTHVGQEVVSVPGDENGEPIMTEDGYFDMEAEPAYYDMGEVGVKVLSPFQVLPNEGATDEDDIDSIIIIETCPVRQIRREYPDVPGIMPEDTSEYDSPEYLMGMARLAGADTHYTGPQFDRSDSGDSSRSALKIHRYERPTPQFPHGRYWMVCCKELLEPPQPLPDGIWLPLIHIKDVEIPGQLLGEATMTAAVGIQREINEHAAKQKEHFKLMVQGKWTVPTGTGVQRGAITRSSRRGHPVHRSPEAGASRDAPASPGCLPGAREAPGDVPGRDVAP